MNRKASTYPFYLLLIVGLLFLAAISEAKQHFSPVRVLTAPDDVCEPEIIDPAVECGCFAYKDYYQRDPKWRDLQRDCLDELGGDLNVGYHRCSAKFMDGSHVIEWKLDEYFEKALKFCAYTVNDIVARFIVPIGRSPMSTVGGEDELPMTVRFPRPMVHRKLSRFCLVMSSRKGYGRTEAYRKCCPSLSRRRTRRKNKKKNKKKRRG